MNMKKICMLGLIVSATITVGAAENDFYSLGAPVTTSGRRAHALDRNEGRRCSILGSLRRNAKKLAFVGGLALVATHFFGGSASGAEQGQGENNFNQQCPATELINATVVKPVCDGVASLADVKDIINFPRDYCNPFDCEFFVCQAKKIYDSSKPSSESYYEKRHRVLSYQKYLFDVCWAGRDYLVGAGAKIACDAHCLSEKLTLCQEKVFAEMDNERSKWLARYS